MRPQPLDEALLAIPGPPESERRPAAAAIEDSLLQARVDRLVAAAHKYRLPAEVNARIDKNSSRCSQGELRQDPEPMELLEPNVAQLEQSIGCFARTDFQTTDLEFPSSPQDTLLIAGRHRKERNSSGSDLSTSCGSLSSQEEDFEDHRCSSPCDSLMLRQKRSHVRRLRQCTDAVSEAEVPRSPLDSFLLRSRRLRHFHKAGA